MLFVPLCHILKFSMNFLSSFFLVYKRIWHITQEPFLQELTTDLMLLLHTVMGLQDRQDAQTVLAITDTCRELIRQLARSNGFQDVLLLYRQELPKLLDILKVSCFVSCLDCFDQAYDHK